MATALDITELPNCRTCRTAEGDMKRCARCLSIHYCSKICQKKDWPRHKAECKDWKTFPSCKVCKKQNIFVKPCKLCESVNYCSETCKKQDLSHGPLCKILKDLLEEKKIKEKVATYTAGHKVLPIKGLLPCYRFGFHPLPALVVKIIKKITFFEEVALLPLLPPLTLERKGVLVQDADGDMIGVCFKFKDPFPHFRWNDLEAGNYLILYAPAVSVPPPIAVVLGGEDAHLTVECAKDVKVVIC